MIRYKMHPLRNVCSHQGYKIPTVTSNLIKSGVVIKIMNFTKYNRLTQNNLNEHAQISTSCSLIIMSRISPKAPPLTHPCPSSF